MNRSWLHIKDISFLSPQTFYGPAAIPSKYKNTISHTM